MIDLNFLSTVRVTQAALPHLLKTGGHLVQIGSLATKIASRYLGAYAASKFPVAAYCQQLRLELGPQGLHTLLVCPGPIRRDAANSACEAALELYRNGAHVTLVHRGPALGDSVKYWVRPDVENRIKEGSIAAHFNTRVVRISPTAVTVACDGEEFDLPAEGVLLLTGYHADPEFLRSAGVEVDVETLAPRYDPTTFETNVPNLFIAGGQVAGKRTGTVFIENGRFHGEHAIRVIADRLSRVGATTRQ